MRAAAAAATSAPRLPKSTAPLRKQQWDAMSVTSTVTLRSMQRNDDTDDDDEDEDDVTTRPQAPVSSSGACGRSVGSNAGASRRGGLGRGLTAQSCESAATDASRGTSSLSCCCVISCLIVVTCFLFLFAKCLVGVAVEESGRCRQLLPAQDPHLLVLARAKIVSMECFNLFWKRTNRSVCSDAALYILDSRCFKLLNCVLSASVRIGWMFTTSKVMLISLFNITTEHVMF